MALIVWRGQRKRRTCPKCNDQTLSRSHHVLDQATDLSDGMGMEYLQCESCGFIDQRIYPLDRDKGARRRPRWLGGSSRPGGSDRGGFGGGRSSGGGSSGKW